MLRGLFDKFLPMDKNERLRSAIAKWPRSTDEFREDDLHCWREKAAPSFGGRGLTYSLAGSSGK